MCKVNLKEGKIYLDKYSAKLLRQVGRNVVRDWKSGIWTHSHWFDIIDLKGFKQYLWWMRLKTAQT